MIPAPPTAGQPSGMSRPGVRSRPQPRRPAFLSQNPLAGSSVPSIPTTGLWLSIYTNHVSMHFLIVWWNSQQNTPYTLKEELCHHKHNKRQICSILLANLIKTCCCNFLCSCQLPNLISRVMQVLLEVAYDIFLAFVLFFLLLRGYHITIIGRQVAPCLHTINKPFYPLQVKHKFYPYCHVRRAPSIDSTYDHRSPPSCWTWRVEDAVFMMVQIFILQLLQLSGRLWIFSFCTAYLFSTSMKNQTTPMTSLVVVAPFLQVFNCMYWITSSSILQTK